MSRARFHDQHANVDVLFASIAQNFLALAACGTYDSTLFHRNIKGFIVQGGKRLQ